MLLIMLPRCFTFPVPTGPPVTQNLWCVQKSWRCITRMIQLSSYIACRLQGVLFILKYQYFLIALRPFYARDNAFYKNYEFLKFEKRGHCLGCA